MIRIELPWPSADLSPNARVHYMSHYRAKKAAKTMAWGYTKAVMGAMGLKHKGIAGPIAVLITFCPEIHRDRDMDDFTARMEASIDGIASALGIDDKHFRPVPVWGEIHIPARVFVDLTPAFVAIEHRGTIG